MIRSSIRIASHGNLLRHPSVFMPVRHFNYAATLESIWRSMSESTPVYYMQETLVTLHDVSGLPWWATIVFSTFALRTIVTLPCTVYQFKIMGRLEKIAHEYPPIIEELKQETAYAIKKYNLTKEEAQAIYTRSAQKQWNNLVVRENCHPVKTFITMFAQIPLWITQSVAIRNLVYCMPNPESIQANITLTELSVGGFLWIPNLLMVDASWILPVAFGAINLLNIQVQNGLRPPGKQKTLQKVMTNVFRVLVVVLVPISAMVPSALTLYWTCSSMYGLGQNLVFLSPKVRNAFGVPELKHVPKENPYQYLVKNMFSRQKELKE